MAIALTFGFVSVNRMLELGRTSHSEDLASVLESAALCSGSGSFLANYGILSQSSNPTYLFLGFSLMSVGVIPWSMRIEKISRQAATSVTEEWGEAVETP
jgi:hypothetical protein